MILGGEPPIKDKEPARPIVQRYALPSPEKPEERKLLFSQLDRRTGIVLVTPFKDFLVDTLDVLALALQTGQPLAVVVDGIPEGFRQPQRAELDRVARDLQEQLGVLTPRISFPTGVDAWQEAGRAATVLAKDFGPLGIEAVRFRDELLRVRPYLDSLHRPNVDESLNAQALLARVEGIIACVEKSIRVEAGEVARHLRARAGKVEEFAKEHSGLWTTTKHYLVGKPRAISESFEKIVMSWDEVARSATGGIKRMYGEIEELVEPLPDEALTPVSGSGTFRLGQRRAAMPGPDSMVKTVVERSGDGTLRSAFQQVLQVSAQKVQEDRYELVRTVQFLIGDFSDHVQAILCAEVLAGLEAWLTSLRGAAQGRCHRLEQRVKQTEELALHVERDVEWLKSIDVNSTGDEAFGEVGQILDRFVGILKSKGFTRDGRLLPSYDREYSPAIAKQLGRLREFLETAPGSIEAELDRLDSVARALLERIANVESSLTGEALFGKPVSDQRREVETLLATHRRQLHSKLVEASTRQTADLKLYRSEAHLFRLVIFGKGKAGKSSFLNFLMGQYIFEEGVNPTTAGRQTHDLGALRLVDLPGTHSVHPQHDRVARDHVRLADLVLYATAADKPLDGEDIEEVAQLIAQRKHVMLLVTRCDEVNYRRTPPEVRTMRPEDAKSIRASVRKNLAARFPHTEIPVFLVSVHLALAGAASGRADLQEASGLAPLVQAIVDRISNDGVALRQITPLNSTLVRVTALREELARIAKELSPHARFPEGLRKTWQRRRQECIDFCQVRVKRLRSHFYSAKVRTSGFLNRSLGLSKAHRAIYSTIDETIEHKLLGKPDYQSVYHKDLEKRFMDEVIDKDRLDKQIADYGAYVEVIVGRGLREFFASLTWSMKCEAEFDPGLENLDTGHVKMATERIALGTVKAMLPLVVSRVTAVVAEMIATRLGLASLGPVGWIAGLLAVFFSDRVDALYKYFKGKTPQEDMLEKLNADLDRLGDQLIAGASRGRGIWPETEGVIREAFKSSWNDAVKGPVSIARASLGQAEAALDEVKKFENSLKDRVRKLRRA